MTDKCMQEFERRYPAATPLKKRLGGIDGYESGDLNLLWIGFKNAYNLREQEVQRLREALELLANGDRDDGTGSIMTGVIDRMGYPVIQHFRDIALEALQETTKE